MKKTKTWKIVLLVLLAFLIYALPTILIILFGIFEESPKTAEEKAIDIAKKDFGTNSNATFSVEGIDGNGNYIVAVRNSGTTEALAFYNVNVTSQTFTKREMN